MANLAEQKLENYKQLGALLNGAVNIILNKAKTLKDITGVLQQLVVEWKDLRFMFIAGRQHDSSLVDYLGDGNYSLSMIAPNGKSENDFTHLTIRTILDVFCAKRIVNNAMCDLINGEEGQNA